MSVLSRRIEALEKRISDLEAPEPALVFQCNSEQHRQELIQQHPGRKIIFITSVCCRKCADDCSDKGGYSCRQAQGVTT